MAERSTLTLGTQAPADQCVENPKASTKLDSVTIKPAVNGMCRVEPGVSYYFGSNVVNA